MFSSVDCQAQTRKKKKKNLGKPPLLIKPRKREYKHVETKRFDVRGKSARQQQPNENGVGRAEERNGCVFFFSSRERASLSLSLVLFFQRGGGIDRSVFSLFLLHTFTIKTRAGALSTDPISFFSLSFKFE